MRMVGDVNVVGAVLDCVTDAHHHRAAASVCLPFAWPLSVPVAVDTRPGPLLTIRIVWHLLPRRVTGRSEKVELHQREIFSVKQVFFFGVTATLIAIAQRQNIC